MIQLYIVYRFQLFMKGRISQTPFKYDEIFILLSILLEYACTKKESVFRDCTHGRSNGNGRGREKSNQEA